MTLSTPKSWEHLNEDPDLRLLLPALCSETGRSSAGFPFLKEEAWTHFRDSVPHLLGAGHQMWRALERAEAAVLLVEVQGEKELEHFQASLKVLRQVLRTAAITAPPSLWLVTYVIQGLREVGIVDRLLSGDTISSSNEAPLQVAELETDLCFLSIMGVLIRDHDGYRVGDGEGRRILAGVPLPKGPAGLAAIWGKALRGEVLGHDSLEMLSWATASVPKQAVTTRCGHYPTLEEVIVATRLLPVVLGMAIANRSELFETGVLLDPAELVPGHPDLGEGLVELLEAAGVLENCIVTPLGARVMERGPGPFGIVEAYHPYLDKLGAILKHGRGSIHLTRAANVAASQRANSASFAKANRALDAFCADTGFDFDVFIEHALGRGEAIRQRWEQAGDDLTYVGADLEDEAVDAAILEQRAGRLPPGMRFIRDADIGAPVSLLEPLEAAGIETQGAVMIVGNGFHEVRQQTDEGMQAVFKEYCDAGLVLLFTEETALSIRDQIATAWNTYHPAFRYTHEKSGQGLRPSKLGPPDPFGAKMPMGWIQVAESGGYVCLELYCRRGRTIFPYPGPDGRNPTTNVTYFFVPQSVWERLDRVESEVE